jgi:hypothetical protein
LETGVKKKYKLIKCELNYMTPNFVVQKLKELASKQASSSLLLAFANMVILGVEPHRDP